MPDAKKQESKVKGPASYFPSIEEQYGHPISYWKQIVRASQHSRHKELVEPATGRARDGAWPRKRDRCRHPQRDSG